MCVFLDANILFSAAKSAGAVRELLARVRAVGNVLCADTYVVEEARRNLARKGPEALLAFERLLAGLEVAAHHPSSLEPEVAARVHEKDRPVLAAAVRMRCNVLLTGDQAHFGALFGATVSGVVVHSPRSLAEWLRL